MTTQSEFPASIGAHPIGDMCAVSRGRSADFFSDDGSRTSVRWSAADAVWAVLRNEKLASCYPVLRSALDAALVILESLKAPPGYVVVDKPTVSDGTGLYLGVYSSAANVAFLTPKQHTPITWLDCDRAAEQRKGWNAAIDVVLDFNRKCVPPVYANVFLQELKRPELPR